MVVQVSKLDRSPQTPEVDFGVRVTGIDMRKLSDDDFAILQQAVYEHLVVVVPNQGHLTPTEQLALTRRFDPQAGEYGHGSNMALLKVSALQNDLHAIPSAPEVKLLGHGFVKEHDDGRLCDVQLKHPMHFFFHKEPLPKEEEGATRFFRWHMDAAFYERHPPRATTLLGLEVPQGKKTQILRYDDGSGDVLEVPMAATAFISGEYAFRMLSPAAKAFALGVHVRYHPYPYIWMRDAKALSTGVCEALIE